MASNVDIDFVEGRIQGQLEGYDDSDPGNPDSIEGVIQAQAEGFTKKGTYKEEQAAFIGG